ncbi:MAG: lysylphosphatidylglycerol synthase transmembrane domain-containing protein, partial [Gaiellales bacterium]
RWPEAIAAVALTDAAAFVVHALGLTATAAVLAKAGFEPVQLPRRWALLVGIVAAITLAGLVVRSQAGRDRLPQVRRAARSLLTVLRHPRQAALVFVGEFGVTAGYVAALWCALRAYGTHPSLLHVTAAYLLSAAIGSISPTSGGLGAIEASLVAALTGLGVPAGPAIAGVLSFRLVTYWLPAVPGFVALHTLRRRGAL